MADKTNRDSKINRPKIKRPRLSHIIGVPMPKPPKGMKWVNLGRWIDLPKEDQD